MTLRQVSYFTLLFILFSSCRKDEFFDPSETFEKPCIYFPAYPGSYWTYNTNVGKTTYEIAPAARRVNGIYLPYFENLDCYINGCRFYHSAYYGLGAVGYTSAPIIATTLDTAIYQNVSTVSFANLYVNDLLAGGPSDIAHRRELFALDTSVTNLSGQTYDQVLIMKEFSVWDTTHYYLEYFAKYIGLVKRDSIHINDPSDQIEILTLDEYFINE
jgi:hypothetical protein